MKIRTLIIDDEPLACMLLEDMLSSFSDIEIIGTSHDGFDGLKKIQSLKPDLIFVDIQMPKITGVEMIELLEEKPMIVFATAYDEYAVKAFEMNAIDYLLKPYDNQRIEKTIEKIKEKWANNNQPSNNNLELATPESHQRLVVKENNLIKIIPIDQIKYIEAAGDYIKIFTPDKFHIKHGKISHYEQVLNKVNFVRIHRSYLLNMNYLSAIEQSNGTHLAILKDKTNLPISKSGFELIKLNIK